MARKHLNPSILQLVSVLKLVNQYVTKPAVVMLTHGGVVAQQFVTAQNQFAKVDHPLAVALGLVQLVEFYFLPRFGIAHHNVFRPLAFFFGTADEIHHLLGRVALFINVELLA